MSDLGHYSLGKTADVLGIGRSHFIGIKTDGDNKVCVATMAEKAMKC